MTKAIASYYSGEFKAAWWLVGIAIINFTLGLLSIRYWGEVGAGILVILGGFAIYQIAKGFWVLLIEQNRIERKVNDFDKKTEWFTKNEIQSIAAEIHATDKYKNYLLISFLLGMFFLLMGAFGGWSELILGIGAALALQSAIMLILGLLANYRATFYLRKLKRFLDSGLE